MRQRYKILVIDDEPITRMDIREMLQEVGYDVVAEGRNGKEAIELTQKWKPNLIIMDVKMPIMDGLKATKIIRDTSNSAVLLLTAYSQREMLVEAERACCLRLSGQAISEEELLPAVEMMIDRHRQAEA